MLKVIESTIKYIHRNNKEMKKHLSVKQLFLLGLTFTILPFIAGCISVTLKAGATSKPSTEVEFKAPASDFAEISNAQYPTWLDKKTGHSISLISDCREEDMSLDQLRNEALTAFDELKNSRYEAAQVTTDSQYRIDGQKLYATGLTNSQNSQILAFIFKKGKCNYTSVLSGKQAGFSSQENEFDKFLTGLRFK